MVVKRKVTKGFGSPLRNPPTNFLFVPQQGDRKLNWRQAKRKYPSLSPYSDYDGDGFINSKDCKPLNPSEDGVFSAIGGFVSGLMHKAPAGSSRMEEARFKAKEGWAKGRIKTERIGTRPPIVSAKERQRMYISSKREERMNTRTLKRIARAKEKMEAIDRQERRQGQLHPVFSRTFSNLQKRIAYAHPTLGRQIQSRSRISRLSKDTSRVQGDISRMESELATETDPKMIRSLTSQIASSRSRIGNIRSQIGASQETMAKSMMKQRQRSQKSGLKMARFVFPVIPEAAMSRSDTYQGKKGYSGRGRPVGSFDSRYAPYGGVFGYRKYKRAQNAYQRYMTQQQMVQQRMQPQVQQMQVPQEVAGATPEYSQFPGYEQQVQQMPTQQIQQQIPIQQVQQHPFSRLPPEREIKPVFRSSGGSPYPPVNSQRPLTPSSQTIQQGYIEDTDLMTGRRYMKPLPKSERWSSGG